MTTPVWSKISIRANSRINATASTATAAKPHAKQLNPAQAAAAPGLHDHCPDLGRGWLTNPSSRFAVIAAQQSTKAFVAFNCDFRQQLRRGHRPTHSSALPRILAGYAETVGRYSGFFDLTGKNPPATSSSSQPKISGFTRFAKTSTHFCVNSNTGLPNIYDSGGCESQYAYGLGNVYQWSASCSN